MPFKQHILYCLLILLPSVFPSIKVFSNESALPIRWPKYWSFSFSISSSSEYSGFIYFKIDWFNFDAVQGTLKSLLQHHSLKASVLWFSVFFIVQLSHAYRPLLAKYCLCFLICCLGFSLLLSKEQMSFNFMAAVTICSDFGAQENKVCYCFYCFPIYLPWSDGTGYHDLHFVNSEF